MAPGLLLPPGDAVRVSLRAAPANHASRIARKNPVTGSCLERPDPGPNVPSAFDISSDPCVALVIPAYFTIGGMRGWGRQPLPYWALVSPEPRGAVHATCRIAKGT